MIYRLLIPEPHYWNPYNTENSTAPSCLCRRGNFYVLRHRGIPVLLQTWTCLRSAVKGATPIVMGLPGGVGRVRRKQNRRRPLRFLSQTLDGRLASVLGAISGKPPSGGEDLDNHLILYYNFVRMNRNHYLYINSDKASKASRASTFMTGFRAGSGYDLPGLDIHLKLLL